MGAWGSLHNFDVISMPANSNFQYDENVVTLSTISSTAGNIAQFELVRRGSLGGDTLSTSWYLLGADITFY